MIRYEVNPTVAGQPAPTVDTRPVVERMAETLLHCAAHGQPLTAEELALRGFTRKEIERWGAEAKDRATELERGPAPEPATELAA